MPTIYLDHNIYSKIYDNTLGINFEELNGKLKEKRYNLVVSFINISEIAKINIKEKRIAIVEFIQRCDTLFLSMPHLIQEIEIRNFLWKNYFKNDNTQASVISKTFLQVCNDFIPGDELDLHTTISDYIDHYIIQNDTVKKCEADWVKGAETTQNYYRDIKNKKITKAMKKTINNQINVDRIKLLLPSRDPENNFIEPNKHDEICEFIIKNIQNCYQACPSIFIEDKLFEHRYKNLERNFDPTHYRDGMHASVGMGYCDKFVSDDKELISDLESVKNNYPHFKLAEVSREIAI